MNTHPSRRGFLGMSMLFVAGTAVACSTDPQGGSGSAGGKAKVTLTQWYHQYGEAGTQDAAKRYAAEYTKENPDIAVQVVWAADTSQYEAKLNAAMLGDEGPDIFEIGDFRYDMVKKGQLAPLDDIYGDAKSDFNPADIEYVTVDGKLYGVKMIDDVMTLYYRKSVLEKAGIEPPQTFDALATAAKSLTTKDMKGLFVGNDGLGDAPYLLLWSNGGELIEGDKVTYASAAGAEAIGGLRRLHQDKSLLLGFTTDWYDPGAISQNAAAMQWCGLWALPGIEKALGDDFGVVPWPAFKAGGRPVARLGGWTELVNAKSKQLDEAKKFVQWLWIKKAALQTDWAVKYGFHVPPRRSVAADTEALASGPAKDAVTISQQYSKTFPITWSQSMGVDLVAATTKVVRENADPAKALGDAADKSQAALNKSLG
ncbi:ABC transporter substrate-binding protein [Streptomyces sp. NPDC091292]|uniref:ABC transporter substrate-binding protein n=1 Tax=Streptomyces sp. NPDC091292 TaxID=3365991 RepID=UPI0037F630DB